MDPQNERQLQVTRIESVMVLSLHRPGNGNRITEQMTGELVAALNQARQDPDTSGCVLTGSGDVFCLGGDFKGAGASIRGRMDFGRGHIDVYDAMARLGKPLVAAINGPAHAGGFSLVLACDLAYIAEGATLGLPEAAHGLFPLLALAVARDAIPKKKLFEIVYESSLLTPTESLALHLVNAIVPVEQVVQRAIRAVVNASKGNAAVLMIGRDLYYGSRHATPEQALDQARFALGAALAAVDQAKT
jgi:enoyl-CoA hydratase/carnithine racemase